jgi:hypothetical protein
MKKIVSYQVHREHDEPIKGCVVGCFDPRFQEALEAYCFAEFGAHLKEMDFVSIGGGTARNADSKNVGLRDDPLQQALASVKLHRSPVVAFTTHEDCGALGGSAHFRGEKAELAWHRAFLNERARTFKALIAGALAGWREKGVIVAGKFIPADIVRATYPKEVAVKTAFLRFNGAWKL